jgi:hypothetical protein
MLPWRDQGYLQIKFVGTRSTDPMSTKNVPNRHNLGAARTLAAQSLKDVSAASGGDASTIFVMISRSLAGSCHTASR